MDPAALLNASVLVFEPLFVLFFLVFCCHFECLRSCFGSFVAVLASVLILQIFLSRSKTLSDFCIFSSHFVSLNSHFESLCCRFLMFLSWLWLSIYSFCVPFMVFWGGILL